MKCIKSKYCGVTAYDNNFVVDFICPAMKEEEEESGNETEDLPPVEIGEKLVDWDGKEVKDGSWYTQTIFEIGDVKVNPLNMTVVTVVIIILVVLICCYCSWRNKKKIAE